MDYKQLNDLLGDLQNLRNTKYEQRIVEHEIDGEGSQGDEGLSYEVYKVPFEEGLFLKLKITTDSYGDNESIAGVEFVKPIEKKILQYIKL